MEGGSANAYDYSAGDPVSGLDLDGLRKKQRPLPKSLDADCYARGNYSEQVFNSRDCEYYRLARANKDTSIFWRYKDRGLTLARQNRPSHISASSLYDYFDGCISFGSSQIDANRDDPLGAGIAAAGGCAVGLGATYFKHRYHR